MFCTDSHLSWLLAPVWSSYRCSFDQGISGVLSQQDSDGDKHVIAYTSCKLLPAEINYTVTKGECLAIVHCIKVFKVYLKYMLFTVFTDHSALQWLLTMKNPTPWMECWIMLLQELNFTIIHCKGTLNQNADFLSRLPLPGLGDDAEEDLMLLGSGRTPKQDKKHQQNFVSSPCSASKVKRGSGGHQR